LNKCSNFSYAGSTTGRVGVFSVDTSSCTAWERARDCHILSSTFDWRSMSAWWEIDAFLSFKRNIWIAYEKSIMKHCKKEWLQLTGYSSRTQSIIRKVDDHWTSMFFKGCIKQSMCFLWLHWVRTRI
jgi:hypothetical protein